MGQKLASVSCFFNFNKETLERNKMTNRITSLQYPANSPIEDRAHCA